MWDFLSLSIEFAGYHIDHLIIKPSLQLVCDVIMVTQLVVSQELNSDPSI